MDARGSRSAREGIFPRAVAGARDAIGRRARGEGRRTREGTRGAQSAWGRKREREREGDSRRERESESALRETGVIERRG